MWRMKLSTSSLLGSGVAEVAVVGFFFAELAAFPELFLTVGVGFAVCAFPSVAKQSPKQTTACTHEANTLVTRTILFGADSFSSNFIFGRDGKATAHAKRLLRDL